MSASVTILCGPARSGKTGLLLGRFREALGQRPFGAALWLGPTWRAAQEVRGRLLDGTLPGCFAPNVMTFANFAELVLRTAGVPIRPVTGLMKRELVRQIIARQSAEGRLRHFRPIAKTTGLVDLVCDFISDLKRLEIWPEEFRQACEARGRAAKDDEFRDIYDAYQRALGEHDLFDAEGRFWSARDVLWQGSGIRGQRREGEKRGGGDERLTNSSKVSPSPPLPVSPSPSFIVVDGFTDFTRTQYEILDALSQRAVAMFITLPLEGEPRRNDLFAKPLDTLTKLERRYRDADVQFLEPSPRADWPAMDRLERRLFRNPREKGSGVRGQGREGETSDSQTLAKSPPLPLSPSPPLLPEPSFGIEILAAALRTGEIELLGSHVKRLLVGDLPVGESAPGGVRPGQIAVVFRSLAGVSELVHEVFDRLGIPFVLEAGQSLDRWPALRALASLVQLDLDDWPFARLLAVLGGNYFQPDWPEWRAVGPGAIERTIRALQIPRGRDRLIEQLGGAGEAQSAATLGVLNRLAGALDALPQRATLPQWAEAWKRLAAETGLLGAMDDASDRHAWDRLMDAAAESDTLAGWLGRPPPELDRPAACDALLDILASDRIGHPGDESGRVRVLSAESVRSISIPYLFLAGLSERVFPSPDREDRLYSETEFLRLIEAGLPLVPRTERNRQEMLLFYEAVTRATKRLYLSFPALDASGQPLLPSPFLREVEQVFGPHGIPRTQQTDLSPVPQSDEPLCEAELRVKAIDMALEGNVALLAGMFRRDQGAEREGERGRGGEGETRDSRLATESPPLPLSSSPPLIGLASNLAAGLELIWLRQDRHGFGPAEGILPSQSAQDRLAAQFPPSHCFSATELERYASCPFAFFMDRILRIKPVEDLALEVDALARGRMVHDVLALLHQQVNERLGRPGSPAELEAAQYDELLAAAIAESLPPEPGNPFQAALREIDRRLVADWLSHYRQQCEKYDGQWQDFESQMAPAVFEKSFGRDDSPAAVATPLACRWQDQVVRISGRIDRIDLGTIAGESVFNVIDYKSGGTIRLDRDTIRAGATLQLPLYALAAMELILSDRVAVPWRAGYWYVRERGFSTRQSLPPADKDDDRSNWEKWQEIRALALEAVVGIVQNIRAGRFAVSSADDHCTGYCPFSTVCRINQVRSLEKTFQPTEPTVAE